MKRRQFLKVSAMGAMATASGESVAAADRETAGGSAGAAPPTSLLASYTGEDHRRRLQHIAICTQSIRGCMRKHLVTDYLPAQCCYNLGEYPGRTPYNPDDRDEEELDRLKAHGIQVLQVFDDWNDSLRLFGGDKYTPANPAGYRRFLDMAHRRGMKVLTYTSPCFIERAHPEFRQEWSREGDFLIVGYWDMARCAPASPGWRAFVLQRIARIIDEYGSDGIYMDGGYLTNRHGVRQEMPASKDEIAAFEETPEHDGAFTDLIALIYNDVKRRGGIVKLHVSGAEQPMSAGLKVYDYLWVGEGVAQVDPLREEVKNHPPYVVPCIDLGFTTLESEDEQFLHAIPYMQFPVLMGGRKFTGERGMIPGVKYNDDFWMERCRAAWKQFQEDPSKLHCHSAWDAVPGSPETRSTHARWLKHYMPLVEEGTWAWLEIGESHLFAEPLPKSVVASAFANRDLHLVIANYGRETVEVKTVGNYISVTEDQTVPGSAMQLPPRSLRILKRQA